MTETKQIKKALIAYSDSMVKNKSMAQRIYNSNNNLIAGVRRGAQSSETNLGKMAGIAKKTVPSLANKAIKSAIGKIPVIGSAPVISSIITSLHDNIYSEIKQGIRRRQLAAAYADNDEKDIDKFQIKNFSMKDIDSYRQKLDEAIKRYNSVTSQSQQRFNKELNNNSVCNYHVDVCMAAAQLERRLNKMIDAYSQIDAIAEVLRKKILSASNEFQSGENSYWNSFDKTMFSSNKEVHENCQKCFRDTSHASIPLNARFASFVSNNVVFSAIVKKTFESAVSTAESKFQESIKNA